MHGKNDAALLLDRARPLIDPDDPLLDPLVAPEVSELDPAEFAEFDEPEVEELAELEVEEAESAEPVDEGAPANSCCCSRTIAAPLATVWLRAFGWISSPSGQARSVCT